MWCSQASHPQHGQVAMVIAETAPELTSTLDAEQKEDNKAGMFEMFQGNVGRKKCCGYPPVKEVNRKSSK